MPIPQDILSVPRPKNTVVIAYGKDKSLYAVRQRIGCRNDNGRHLPVNGPTIGHIIDGVYVPIDKEAPDSVSASSVDLKDWANVVLCDRLFSDIRKELSAVYSQTDVMKMYCISILRVCDPGVKNYELKEAYETSFLSELYPGVALSKNTVSTFLNDMGKSVSKIVRFMHDVGIGYGSINHPVDRDPVCGFNGIIGDCCPHCGRTENDGNRRFERIRRITGYLVGTLDRFNNAKRAEEGERVKHGV